MKLPSFVTRLLNIMPCITDLESLASDDSVVSVSRFNTHRSPSEKALMAFLPQFLELASCLTKKEQITTMCEKLKNKHHISPSKSDIRGCYEKSFSHIPVSPVLTNWLIKNSVRSNSGVLVVTITLSPHKFSCKYDCFYCPQETDLSGVPTQPRSYLSTEPAMLRALASRSGDSYDFDVKKQFLNRIKSYIYTGSIKTGVGVYKMEIILSGGTWESYPIEYREQVINELYWAANTLGSGSERSMGSLEQEILENETGVYRIVGLTLETRPDNITPQAIKDYCRWGCTRVQIGVQHFDDTVLKKINRKCYTEDTVRAIRLLKQAGFKVVVHLMPDLPGSSPELDKWMFQQALSNPDLQFDDVKIYPTAVCKSSDPERIVTSKIADWFASGKYMPYAEVNLESLISVLCYYKERVQPWIRIQRLIRDIPAKSMESGYNKVSNLRQVIQKRVLCKCVSCMEIGDKELDLVTPLLVVRKYIASKGVEYFISFEAHTMNWWQQFMYLVWHMGAFLYWLLSGVKLLWPGSADSYAGLYGFLRLRFDEDPGGDFITEINACGLIREVHVYGLSLGVGEDAVGSQHRGFGKRLVVCAEQICALYGFRKTAVIAGVGTREYYKNKCGYKKGQYYMLKRLAPYDYQIGVRLLLLAGLGFSIGTLAQ